MKRKNGLISIIVPIYNVEKYLEKCIVSILKQTYENFEVILVNDGSSDGSGVICDDYKERDSRITVIHQRNRGVSVARNVGISVSQGQYLMFVDGDDYLSSELCEKMIKKMEHSNAQCCVCGWEDVDIDGCVLKSYVNGGCSETIGIEALKDLYVRGNNAFNTVVCWGKLFHWSIWEELRFTEGIYYEDLDVMPKLYLNCKTIVSIPYIGYHYLQRIGSLAHGVGTDDKRYRDSYNIRLKHISFYETHNEERLAYVNICNLLDLIITSDMMSWIPIEEKKQTKKSYYKYLFKYLSKTRIDKVRFRYVSYGIFGKQGYHLIKKIKEFFN